MYDQIFQGIANAKPISNFTQRLGAGRHTVALLRYSPKPSQRQGQGPIVEADFMVLESTNPAEVGQKRGWAWFISSQGYAGAYEQARAKDFIEAVKSSIDDTRPVADVGGDLSAANQPGRGLVLTVDVVMQFNNDGSPKMNKKGQQMSNATWGARKQTFDDIKAVRAKLDEMEASAPAPAPAPQPQASAFGQVAAPAPQPQPSGTMALLGSLGRK